MLRISHLIAYTVFAVVIVSVPAYAQQPPFATTKVEGTDNVYIFRYGNSQAMFVVTSAGVIATDPIGYGRPQAVTTMSTRSRRLQTNQSSSSFIATITTTTSPAANHLKTPALRSSRIRELRSDSPL
jgi:hypothetical protein